MGSSLAPTPQAPRSGTGARALCIGNSSNTIGNEDRKTEHIQDGCSAIGCPRAMSDFGLATKACNAP